MCIEKIHILCSSPSKKSSVHMVPPVMVLKVVSIWAASIDWTSSWLITAGLVFRSPNTTCIYSTSYISKFGASGGNKCKHSTESERERERTCSSISTQVEQPHRGELHYPFKIEKWNECGIPGICIHVHVHGWVALCDLESLLVIFSHILLRTVCWVNIYMYLLWY